MEKMGLKIEPGSQDMFPTMSMGSITGPNGGMVPLSRDSETYTFADSLLWTKASHSFKFGFEWRIQSEKFRKPSPGMQSFSFSRNQTAKPDSLNTTGLEFASFMLGQVNSASLPLKVYAAHARSNQLGVYAQDDFKITSALTLNLGVRFDLYTPITDLNNNYQVINLDMPNPAAGNLPGVYIKAGENGMGNRLPPADKNAANWSPRVGLAYKINDKTVIRSGYGISYMLTAAYGNNTYVSELGDGFGTDNAAVSLDQLSAAFILSDGFPESAIVRPPVISPGLGVGTALGVNYWSKNAARALYQQNWNLTLQRQLLGNLSLGVGYVGSKTTHAAAATNVNQLNPKYFSLGATLLNSNINDPAVVAAGFKPPYAGFNGTLGQALRPYPQYLNMSPGGRGSDTSGSSTYHSLQATFQKRFSGGLGASMTYTWSQWLTDAAHAIVAQGVVNRNIYDRSMGKNVVDIHRPHVVAISFNYELPFGPGKRLLAGGGALGKIVGGWQLNGILRYSHGNRLGVSAPQTNPTYTTGTALPQTADRVAGVDMYGSRSGEGGKFNPAVDRWVNPAAFALPAGVFGTAQMLVEGLYGQAFFNEDLGLEKTTSITESVSLELRFEAFNAFNRTRFGNPSTNLGTMSTFGKITSASGQRNAQISAKIRF